GGRLLGGGLPGGRGRTGRGWAGPRQPGGRGGHDRAPATNFSTYFAITSTSRFTGSPGCLRPRVVIASVVGIRLTENESSVTDTTVSDTPSTVIDPFGTRYRASDPGSPIRTSSQSGPGRRSRIVPTPSRSEEHTSELQSRENLVC